MMPNNYFIKLVSIILISLSVNVFGQFKNLVCLEYWTPQQIQFQKDNNLDNQIIVYEDYFVDNNTKFNPEKLKKFINKIIPKKNQTGYAILDWEGTSVVKLMGEIKVSDKEYDRIIDEYIKAIDYAKKMRPKMKWGYFGINLSFYPKVYKKNYLQSLKMNRLYKKLDFLAPCLYVSDIIKNNKKEALDFLYTNLKNTVDINTGNLEILPFVWHRIHNAREDNVLMSNEDFTWYITTLKKFSYKSKKISGVFWWNAESYLSQNPKKTKEIEKEFFLQKNNEKYQYQVLKKYYNILNKNFN